MTGDLGSGKTCFVQGLARGLGVSAATYVTSPSYTLVNTYRGRLPLHHVDLYRLSGEDGSDLGLEELMAAPAVTAEPAAPTAPAASGTRERIVEAAEALFAERGFEMVSLRDITSRAGANVAAVNYHFRSRAGLVNAVIERYIEPINRERLELLTALEKRGGATVEEILETLTPASGQAASPLQVQGPFSGQQAVRSSGPNISANSRARGNRRLR